MTSKLLNFMYMYRSCSCSIHACLCIYNVQLVQMKIPVCPNSSPLFLSPLFPTPSPSLPLS